MSTISSSAYYNVSSSSSNSGISGLMSGMDTDQMVEDMLAGTQAKIDAQKGMEMQAEWKQEMYRDIIEKINDFSSKYFDSSFGASSTSNLFSDDFFNNMVSSITGGSALKILGTTSSAYTGDMEVVVNKLATAAKLESSERLSSSNAIIGSSTSVDSDGNEFDIFTEENLTKMFNKEVVLEVDGTEVSVNLNGASTENDIIERFQTALTDAGSDITVAKENGAISFSDSDKIEIKDSSSSLGLETAGLVAGKASAQYGRIDTMAGLSFDISFDGINKTVTINDIESADNLITVDEFEAALKQEVKVAFGNYITADIVDGALKFALADPDAVGHEIRITGIEANSLGITPGSTSMFNTSQKLSEVANGGSFEFSINGVDFSFDGDTSVGAMMNEINRSDAGVRMSYSTLTDTMKLEATSTGASYNIELSQTEGDILTKLFGDGIVSASNTASSVTLSTAGIQSADKIFGSDYAATSATLHMTVNGTLHTFTLPEKASSEDYSRDEVIEELNSWLKTTFGSEESGKANISYELSADGTSGTLNTNAGFAVSFNPNETALALDSEFENIIKTDLGVALGLTTAAVTSNIVSETTELSSIVGMPSSVTGTVQGALDALNATVGLTATFEDGQIKVSGDAGDYNLNTIHPALSHIFGRETLTLSDGGMTSGVVSEGSDAELVINGIATTRSSNTFTVDGVTMQATKVSEGSEPTTVSTVRNDDDIVETMKAFIEDYNELIGELNELTDEEASYKEYPPLTEAQKNEMTDNEIELWEEKSREGLLRNDSYILSLLSEMRTILYTVPEGASIGAYQIGIETTSDYEEGGKLQFDETAFRNALASDPDAISDLFSGPTGLASMLEDAADRVANTSSGSPGSLVSLAGVKGLATEENNEISRNILYIQERIERLEYQYEMESARYWSQFTTMETVMNQYNSQSMMLSSQFGTGYY